MKSSIVRYKIYFFANLGDWNKKTYGGGEVGNRRTLELLKRTPFEIVLIPKYNRVNSHSFLNLIILVCKMFRNICRFAYVLLCGQRKKSLVHITGFYGSVIYFEYVLVLISKKLGYRTIYEMRGGGADLFYSKGNFLYKYCFRKTLNQADLIFSQGKENYSLIHSLFPKKDIFYYPNYVMSNFYPKQYIGKPDNKINLVYFGRITSTKNIDIILDTFILLEKKYDNMFLYIVGNCSNKVYYNQLINRIKKLNRGGRVHIEPACSHDELKEFLKDKHFYIFPTTEPHEGHSNALTEAMSWGLIPVTTDNGFNKSVIGNEKLIVTKVEGKEFARVITEIIEKNIYNDISKLIYDRVQSNYTDCIILDKLRNKYNEIFASNLSF